MNNSKTVFDFIRKNVTDAFNNNESMMIFPEVYVWRMKGNMYGLARAEGTYPLSVHSSIPEVLKAAFERFVEDKKIAVDCGFVDQTPWYTNPIVFSELGDEFACTIDELIDEANKAINKHQQFSAL